jgi:two-component system, OmpR family, alkaline phosphatase synthesis response regulator PhoP
MELRHNKILVVDDEEDIVEFVSYNLKKEGFNVNTAKNGREAITRARLFKPHLILLDIMMPEMDGIEACEEIRNIPDLSKTLIAFLSARSEDYSQIAGFNAGADDFIAKPIRPKVLTSRIKALLKRYSINRIEKTEESKYAEVSDVLIDHEKHIVIVSGMVIDLPKKEFNLLSLLLSKPNRVFTREEIFNHIWGSEVYVSDRTIDVYIRKLRGKIGQNRIKTIKGVGYKFEA